MPKSLPVSLRLPPETNARLAAAAAALDRPKSWVIEQALNDYLATADWHRQAIEDGLRAADAGDVIAHDDVAAWVRSWNTPTERGMP